MVTRKNNIEKAKGKNSILFDNVNEDILATIKEAMYGLGGNNTPLLHEVLVLAIVEKRVKYEALEEFYSAGLGSLLYYDIKTIKKELGI